MAVNQCCCGAKLSPNKKSIFGLRNQIMFLAFFVCVLAGATASDPEISCSNVKSIFESKGMLSSVDIQEQPNSDAGELCLTKGCCGAGARSRLSQAARTHLETSLRSELSKLAEVLANRAKRFDEFFRKLLQQSREEFHAMFKRTYGMIYEQHSYVFEQLFEQLERYYARGDTDLDHMMDNFFGILYQKMFTVLNSQYSFDDKYLKCVSEHMRETQPFEDVPHKLSVQLRRAFVATRTFHKALRAGADIVRNMQQVGITQECVTSWARLKYCGTCSDARPAPCSRYCHNVLRGCLPAHADLAQQWDAYVDAVEKVADRLLGPFNIVMVVEPIDIKISEAIMNFQEHNQEISQKIFAGCGKPVLGGGAVSGPFFSPDRSRRSVRSIPDVEWTPNESEGDDFEIEASYESLIKEDPMLYSLRSKSEIEDTIKKMSDQAEDREKFLQYMRGDLDAEEYEEHERRKREAEPGPASAEIDYRAFEFEGKKKKKKPTGASKENGRDAGWGGPALERLVRETRARVRSSRRYWAGLPYLLCGARGAAAPPAPAAPCYNGTHVASYTLAAAGEGSAALASNPEVRGLAAATAAAAQQEALKTLTARLKDAYNGVEVLWRDADDLQTSAQSLDSVAVELGSGSGSGDDADDPTDDDEDRNQDVDYPASGQGPPEDDEAEVPDNRETETRQENIPPASEVPFTPYEVPNTRIIDDNIDIDNTIEEKTDAPRTDSPVREKPMSAGAERPSLHKALLSYALPVVCAWFGTIVTDLI